MTTPIYRLLSAIAAWWAVSRVSCAGYDEYMTCGTGSERYGRQYRYHPNLPCDMSKESFCDTAGTQYPWSAVRRFVYENQGLMKRMYGNQRHYNVLRAELINEMYEEMYDEMPIRHQYRYRPPAASSSSPSSSTSSSLSNSRTARYQKNSNTNSLKTKSWTKSVKETGRQGSRAIKVTAEPEYHHHHQRNQASSTTTSPRSKIQSNSSGNRLKTTSLASDEAKDSSVATDAPNRKSTRINTRRPQATTTNPSSSAPTTMSVENIATTAGHTWSSGKENNAKETHASNGLPLVEKEEREENEDINNQPTFFPPPHHHLDELDLLFGEEEIWTTIEDLSMDTFSTPTSYPSDLDSTYSTIPQQEMFTSTPATAQSDVAFDDLESEDDYIIKEFISTPSDKDDLTTVGLSDIFDDEVEVNTESYDQDKSEIDFEFEEKFTINDYVELEKVEEEMVVDTKDQEITLEEEEDLDIEMREDVSAVEGEVHKDVLEDVEKHETSAEPIRIKRPMRGINACPVKEEFVAPYWANNTRGETLALLNLYPFEQYVQWERCMYEHRQMYCRKGCRCEQQYRLHKLLAFDPTNECRGIFSDWFRFPSCCVCKCYDLPQDLFTASARRPRHRKEEGAIYGGHYSDRHDDDAAVAAATDDDDDDDDDDFPAATVDDNNDDDDGDDGYIQQVRIRSGGGRLANIPPQRRPRKPPRPYSHISIANPSVKPTPPPPPPSQSSKPHSDFLNSKTTSPSPPPEVSSTLGTVDTATPHYYHNISSHARLLFANAQPFPLSRIPRSNPEV